MNERRAPSKPSPRQTAAWTPTRPQRRGADPASLGDVLVGAQAFLAERSGSAIPRDEWRSIVGPRIAARTRVGKVWKGTLTIKVASSAWSNELSLLKPELLAKLRRAGRDIDDLRFRVDKIQTNTTPQNRYLKNQSLLIPKQTELSPELLAKLQKVEDPNLRAAIAEAARWSMREKK